MRATLLSACYPASICSYLFANLARESSCLGLYIFWIIRFFFGLHFPFDVSAKLSLIFIAISHRHTTLFDSHSSQTTNLNTPRHPYSSHMSQFSIFLRKPTFSSQRAANARKAALNAINYCLNDQGEGIVRDFGSKNSVVVL